MHDILNIVKPNQDEAINKQPASTQPELTTNQKEEEHNSTRLVLTDFNKARWRIRHPYLKVQL